MGVKTAWNLVALKWKREKRKENERKPARKRESDKTDTKPLSKHTAKKKNHTTAQLENKIRSVNTRPRFITIIRLSLSGN